MARTSEIGNLPAFPKVLDFLDENDRKEPPAGAQSSVTKLLEHLSQKLLSRDPFSTDDSCGENDLIFPPFSIDAAYKAK
jgi:hypothetical protein